VSLDAEVCVIGGGPTGAALASRLATLGHDVVVVERHAFPRPHVGESVSPGVWPLLELLGARAAVEAAGFPRSVRARVRWGEPERLRSTVAQPGITVDRGAFDQLLLINARRAGATVFQTATARRCVLGADGWKVEIATADGTRVIRARFLADATGRRRVLCGTRRHTSVPTVALHACWRGVRAEEAQTRIEARPEGWLWGAHLRGGMFRAMAFVDLEFVRRRHGRGIERLYRSLLADSSLFDDLVAGEARLEERFRACDATCYTDENPIGDTFVKVGEACFAIDPLSSSGVQTAIQTGVAASAAVRSILAEDGDTSAAIQYYQELQEHSARNHARLTARAYRDCEEYAEEPFWRRRAAQAPAVRPTHPPTPLADLLPARVRLTRDAILLPSPCVVGDRVELRRALSHPTLSRPVAYLGGVEVAPLLDRLTDDRALGDVLTDWQRILASGAAVSIAGWLVQRGLIEAVEGGVNRRHRNMVRASL
jgi:flavin-dependent dehydrogenase